VRRLHRGNDSELRESRNVAGTQDLRVLDAPTRCSDRPPLYGHAVECLLVEVQHDAIAPVSYGVRLDLQPPTERLGQDRKQRGLAVNRQPSGIGSIAIRREQGCTA